MAKTKEKTKTRPKPIFDEAGHFQGHTERECNEHRTVGSHRAWCFDCTEWCYPAMPCKGCEIVLLRRKAAKKSKS